MALTLTNVIQQMQHEVILTINNLSPRLLILQHDVRKGGTNSN